VTRFLPLCRELHLWFARCFRRRLDIVYTLWLGVWVIYIPPPKGGNLKQDSEESCLVVTPIDCSHLIGGPVLGRSTGASTQ
jgi:hypothetical protein